MLHIALNQMPERWIQNARIKERPTEMMVAVRVVNTELPSIGRNCGEVTTARISPARILANNSTSGKATVMTRYAASSHFTI